MSKFAVSVMWGRYAYTNKGGKHYVYLKQVFIFGKLVQTPNCVPRLQTNEHIACCTRVAKAHVVCGIYYIWCVAHCLESGHEKMQDKAGLGMKVVWWQAAS